MWREREGAEGPRRAAQRPGAPRSPPPHLLWGAACQGPVVEGAAREAGVEVEVVRRAEEDEGFVAQKRRWVVERTTAWLTRHRRLARDDERHEDSSEAFIHIARTGSMLRRLA